MRILITGGGGFIGQKLARALAAQGKMRGQTISELTLIDIAQPREVAADFPVTRLACNVAEAAAVNAVMSRPSDVVFHLAAVVSGAAEKDFDLGMQVNLFGTLNLFDAARRAGNCPVIVYASSNAVHGGDGMPAVVHDNDLSNPQTSYGTQKIIGEYLLTDYSRRGFLDGRGLRLPTVTVRPGAPNAAASSFMSSIFRDTLQGNAANCPVQRDFEVWHTAPRTVVSNLLHAAEIDGAAFGTNRCINLSGRTDTIGQMIAAMTRATGPDAEARITWNADPVIEKIVSSWATRVQTDKALRLGFSADRSFEDSIRWFVEDDISLPA
ncbi:MAG: NAD-dependent dehydratase [Cereibacter sphaeroides]|uniref:NAD-dependent dehydratase n=1 Tax=Cereibacter sphaeroides TaxID=1063 RepID=A0A2W5TW74_CERSP|nr:MAG: NAD-dependent dehydratase [Cereibacter sphaeroides]